jgi:hypothetical protein
MKISRAALGDGPADQSDCRYAVAEDNLSFLQVFGSQFTLYHVYCLKRGINTMITIGRSYAWH